MLSDEGGEGPSKADMSDFLNSDELTAKMKKDFIAADEFGRLLQRVEKMESYMPDLIAKVKFQLFKFINFELTRWTAFWSMWTS